jgi:hypothetical protein
MAVAWVLEALIEILQVKSRLFRPMSRGIAAGSRSHTSAHPGSIAVESAELFSVESHGFLYKFQ